MKVKVEKSFVMTKYLWCTSLGQENINVKCGKHRNPTLTKFGKIEEICVNAFHVPGTYVYCINLKISFTVIQFFFSFAVDGLKVETQGGGQFRQQLISGDFTVTIVYPELKEKFVKLFGELQKACESAPVDKNYK